MRIICYTDHSEPARGAAAVATALAHRTADTVLLFHPASAADHGLRPSVDGTTTAGPVAEASPGADDGASPENVVVRLAPVADAPDRALAAVALPAQARLIVVAATPATPARAWAHEGLAESVAERAPVPTLVVRDPAPLLGWLRSGRLLRVLCGYDFSASADAALAAVKELLRLGPCEVLVVQVGRLPEQLARFGFPMLHRPRAGNGTHEAERLLERDLRERVEAALGPDTDAKIRFKGDVERPDLALLEVARTEQADLIVTGTRQLHGLDRLLAPSVSRVLVRCAPVNVLVTPRSSLPEATAVRPPRRILVPTDFSEAGNLAIRHAFNLVPPGGTIRLLHVVHPQELPNGAYVQGIGDGDERGEHARHLRACRDRLRALVPDAAAAREISAEVELAEHRDPADGIMHAAERFGADLICLGTHERSGLSAAIHEPVARRILTRSKRPLLVVHPPMP